ncbi:DoxX family protein [Pollutimonas harenae]|uniref:DoxX family protein n=1 Tax=Pollutimonas harenae TaxID=657015 RepID=A0A853GXT5_9BURK|nr:DoxX family protein [Pollutimonas harenae]NYT84169.1 DoxX family protein [Pollutimonas harenae]TEA73415.1 DoxX family protein [Pollutimonas harenae]
MTSNTVNASTPTASFLNLLGRLAIVALFLPAGLSKITGFAGTVGYIGSVGLPAPTLAAIVAIIVEVGGGLALIAGYRTRLVALVLAIFTAAASFAFHTFWSLPAEQVMMQQLLFYKNIAIVGGLLILAANGAGAFSLDARRSH